ncbi:MAG: ankyrin repeat domain-containing protein [Acidobacteria bacterium]|nr:ankyrin repeat domain-containing protein [Acidobacteriota bacterium]
MEKALSPTLPPTDEARAWQHAVEAGDAARVKTLLASGMRVEATLGKGETALARAAARGYADVVQILLGAGAHVNARREDGFTPLILAVFFGHEEIVRLLLGAGADVTAQTSLGTTAEKWAASRGFREIVELLKDAGAARVPAQESGSRPEGEAEESRTVEVAQAVEDAPGKGDSDDSDSDEGATFGELRPTEISESPFVVPDRAESKTTTQDLPSVSRSRFGRALASWPVTAAAVVLIVASAVAVYTLRRGAAPSGAGLQPVSTATGEAPQTVVPLTPPPIGDATPQPSPNAAQVAQPSPLMPGDAGVMPFNPNPQNVVIYEPPLPAPRTEAAPSSNSLSVVSESGGGGGGDGRTSEGGPSRSRAVGEESRETTRADAPGATREDKRGDEDASGGATARTPPRTEVETRRITTAPLPPASRGNAPAPTATPERRKVIQWP